MTNKPMLSVELRALLERLLSHDFAEECQECGIGYSDAWGELRALLDKPVVESEFEPDAVCMESDGCPTEVAVLKRFWRENQPDTALCKFYEAADYQSLVKELVGHVSQLQEAAKRNVKPWEDTFPSTLLPAYIARINAEKPAPVAVVLPDNDAIQQRLIAAEQFVQKMVDCTKGQDSIATGYLSDILDLLKPAEEAESYRTQEIPGTSFQRLNQLANEGE